jgi:glycosyltransferase involved in cell wall biosynthesis
LPSSVKPQKMAYLASTYPYVSQSFIIREVQKLRALDFDIQTASINPPDRPYSDLAEEEREELAVTFCVKNLSIVAMLRAHLATVAQRPGAYLRGLFGALRMAGTDRKQLLLAVGYFVEAVIIGRWMASRRLRHLHVHLSNPASTVGLIASRIFPIEFSFTAHGPDEFYDVPGYRLMDKISGASFVRCIAYFTRSQLMRVSEPRYWNKFEVARLGVDPEVFAPRPFRQTIDRFEILCVGRLVPSKGQHVLIAAVDHLSKAGRKVCLRLVGNGIDQQSLEREVKERGVGGQVVFEGPVNQDRIRELYRKADLFVLASFAEGIPVALMEAMAMEIPCVTTFIAGIPELIRDNIDGLLVAASDEFALAQAIERLIDDPELRCSLGRAGRQRVIEKFNLDLNVAQLAAIFATRLKEQELRGNPKFSPLWWRRWSGQSQVPVEQAMEANAFPPR